MIACLPRIAPAQALAVARGPGLPHSGAMPGKLLLALAFGAMCASTNAMAQTVIDGGRPIGRIYVAPRPAPPPGQPAARPAGKAAPADTLALAVGELNEHLKKMSGASLAVVETGDPDAVKGPSIVLGDLAVRMGAEPQKLSESQEGFRLLTRGRQLLIGGQSDAAVLIGVYALLEALGCDWVMPGAIGEVVPKRRTVAIPAMDRSEAPDFAMRRLWYGGGKRIVSAEEKARFDLWQRRQRGGDYQPVAQQTAGHVWQAFIRRHQAEFDRDPTMYALRRQDDGTLVREGPQIETTHPRVIALMAQDIRDRFAKEGWPKDKKVGFPIGPADGFGFSESPETIAAGANRFDPAAGVMDMTDQIVLLGNQILDRLGPDYPNVLLGFYSYAAHAGYPLRYRPNPRIAVIFAPITYSRFHSVVDPLSRSQAPYRKVVERWAALSRKQGNPLIFRGYNWNLSDNLLPYTKARIWGEDLPFYKAMGIIGLNVEATKAWSINAPGDWIFMKLAWNASQDWHALLRDYCNTAYGRGGPAMLAYFLRLAERQHSGGQEAGAHFAFPLLYDRAFVAAAKADIDRALRDAAEPDQKTRIRYVADTVRALELYLDFHEAGLRFDFAGAKAAFDAMLAHWQQSYARNSDSVAREGVDHLQRLMGTFVDESVVHSRPPYRIVASLPDQLQTAFASEEQGLKAGFAARDADEAAFAPTRTISSTWDAQRLGGGGHAVWYRHHFRLPPAARGKKIGLFLGGFDDQAKVWINGRLVGESDADFSAPARFDLTPALDPDGDNVLAIHITRAGGINEIGVGGLLRPSFLYEGDANAGK